MINSKNVQSSTVQQQLQQEPSFSNVTGTTGLEEDWKTKLKLPEKDLRPKTEVF